MSWLRIAAEIVRGAMSSREPLLPKPEVEVLRDSPSVFEIIQKYRSDVEHGLTAVSQEIQAQNERHERALRIQRRWNYGLLAGLLALGSFAAALYLRN
jgi:hypothetical protein